MEPTATLAAETGIAVYKVAIARWIADPAQPDPPTVLTGSAGQLGNVLTARLTTAAAPWPRHPGN